MAVLVFVFILLSSRKAFNKIVSLLEKIKFTSKFVEPLSSSYDATKDGIRGPITLYASGLSIFFWLLEAISIYFILMAFGVETIGFLTIISTYTTSIMLGILSFLPLGLGVVEGTLASFFVMHDIDALFSVNNSYCNTYIHTLVWSFVWIYCIKIEWRVNKQSRSLQ